MDMKPGELFYHPEHGIGQVLAVLDERGTEAQLQFKDRLVVMTSYTIGILKPVHPQSLRAQAHRDPASVETLLAEQPADIILMVLEDFPEGRAKTEEIKEYLAPYIKDWEKWWEKTQTLIKEDRRIDTSKSKLREYALGHDLLSSAEEGYRTFRLDKRRMAPLETLVERAISVLRLKNQKGAELSQEHAEELLEFLNQIVRQEKQDIALRLVTLFRMREEKLLPPDEIHWWLEKLLEQDICLYKMDDFASRRMIHMLLKLPVGPREIDILATGMCCPAPAVLTSLTEWAARQLDYTIASRFLITALTQNLPPELPPEKIGQMGMRLEACLPLLRCVPKRYAGWAAILRAFQQTCSALAAVDLPEAVRAVLPPLLQLAQALRARGLDVAESQAPSMVQALAAPAYPLRFVLAVLDASRSSKDPRLFEDIRAYMFSDAGKRQDDFLEQFSERSWEEVGERIANLTSLIVEYASPGLVEIGGRLICENAAKLKEDELINLLPYLNQLAHQPGDWSWRDRLGGLREKGYLAMFRGYAARNGYQDDAMVHAAQQAALLQMQENQHKSTELQAQLKQALGRVGELEALEAEKDSVIRELRSRPGGNTEEARFNERARICKDIASSVAEFESYAASLPEPSRDLDALLKRFTSILSGYKISSGEGIGARVAFSPQKHRLTGSDPVNPGDWVSVVERGYLIRDNNDKPRVLKQALVKKA